MVRLLKTKLVLITIVILLALWNYLWRETINLPYLSGLSSTTVYIIAGIILVIDIIINFTIKDRY
jgi:hypothetical protein|tara:strand:+ start:868 stop:1062 length:195 start_codon:yes stop_codon:yes gene_type:complete